MPAGPLRFPNLLSSSFRICLEGPAKVVRSGDQAAPGLERKQAALLAWLGRHGATPRSRLAGLLWPAAPEARARGNLRQSLSKLRQAAGDVAVDEGGLLALAAGAVVEPATAGGQWLDAFQYDDCPEFASWLEGEREAARARHRQALLAEVRLAAQSGALDRALDRADALLALDRESEEAYRTLMEVFYLRGDRAAAIAVWDRCREMMRGLYGVLPSAATQQLGQTLLDSTASAPMAAVTAIPVTLLRPPRLIGRAGLVARLVAGWQVGDAVCVSGEGGVGKSRLLTEFAAAIGPCAVVAARPGDALRPFASLSRMVLAAIERFAPPLEGEPVGAAVRLLPQIAAACGRAEPEPLRTPYERMAALQGLAELLARCVARGCAAFVFDDLQFADPASIEALQALAERGASAAEPIPARLALGSRDDELTPPGQALLDSLDSARRRVGVRLEPLAEAEVLELMQSLDLPGFDAGVQAPRLRRRVGGNPAYLLESVKLVAALGQLDSVERELPVPPGIEAVVERRLALLSPEARHIAELAAVAGESFSIELAGRALARALPALGEPLRELEWRQVLYGRQFVHDIVASAVRRSVPAAVADLLHRFVAEQLEAAGAEPAVVGTHWQACAEWRRAARSFLAAAARSRQAVRPADLAHHLDAAAHAFGQGGEQAARFAALRERLQVSTAPDYLLTRKAQLERLHGEARGEEQQLQAELETVSWHADHVLSDTFATSERGLARAEALGLHRLAFEFAHPLAWQYAGRGEPARALATIEAQRSWVLAQEDLSLQARYFIARSGTLAFSDRLGEAIEDTERGLAVLRAATADPLQMLPLLANLGLYRSWRGEFASARDVLVEAASLRDRLHGRGTALIIDLHLGAALRDLGSHAQALAMLEAALAEYRSQLVADGELLTDLVVGENHLAQLWLALGDTVRAEAALASDAGLVDARFQARRATLRARAARLAGRHDERPLADLAAHVAALPESFARALAELELLRSAAPAAAMARLSAICEQGAVRERPGLRLHALSLLHGAALAAGDMPAATAAGRELIALEPHCLPFDADPLDIWRIAFAELTKAGQADAAAAIAERAERWHADSCAALPEGLDGGFAHRGAQALQAMGRRPAPSR